MTKQQPTFYDILNVDPAATQEEIKKSYQQLVLKYHPDKRKSEAQDVDEDNDDGNSIFIAIDEAWKVLRDPELRHVYDVELRQSDFNDKPIVHETLTKKDFEYDPESELYFHNCRCGGIYVLPDEEGSSGEEEVVYISCDECSLVIEVELNKR